MNKIRGGRVGLLLGSVVLALRALGAEQIPGAELARCAAVSAPDERLACYDKLAGRSAQKSPAAAASAPKTPSAAPPPAPTAAAAPAGAADAAATAAAASRFGLPPPPAIVPEPAKIEARITRVNADRQGNATLILDNGQTWSVQAPDQWLQAGDNVTIRQAALGSYLLTTPARHTFRVRRVQ